MLQVRVGNVDFHGFTTGGFLIGPDGFKGWEGAPATKRDAPERVGAHGSFSARSFKSGRLVALSGHALADSEAELEHLGEVLAGVGQSEQKIVVQSSVGARWGVGTVEGEIKFDRVGEATEATWSLTLFMPDPFKYGETREFPSTPGAFSNTYHRGTTGAHSRFRVTASTSMPDGYSLLGKGGRIFHVAASLAAGKVAEVDFKTGIVRHDGVRVAGVTPRPWLVNGGEVVGYQLIPVTGTGTAVCFLTDTFA